MNEFFTKYIIEILGLIGVVVGNYYIMKTRLTHLEGEIKRVDTDSLARDGDTKEVVEKIQSKIETIQESNAANYAEISVSLATLTQGIKSIESHLARIGDKFDNYERELRSIAKELERKQDRD
jgi:septation ring formation regulator EzrA